LSFIVALLLYTVGYLLLIIHYWS